MKKSNNYYFVTKLLFIVATLLGIYSCDFSNPADFFNKKGNSKPGGEIDPKVWQSKLSGTRSVSSVFLPGTHDAGTFKGSTFNPFTGGAFGKTQDLNITEQLKIGVRAFDIRLGYDEKKHGKFGIYHGFTFQNIYFNPDIMDQCISFLNQNPTEFLVFLVSKEKHDYNKYKEALNLRLNNSTYKKYIIKSIAQNLTVEQVRGKIIFLHRTDIGANAASGTIHNWSNNATSLGYIKGTNNQKVNLYIEDEYSKEDISTDQKWDVTRNHLELSASNKNANDWFITFSSFSGAFKISNLGAITTPKKEADVINPKVISHLEKGKKAKGILFVDFAKDNLTKAIINANF